jgi:hypothetical protein
VDRLLVELIEKQTPKGEEIITSYEITKILKYVKAPEQESLELNENHD